MKKTLSLILICMLLVSSLLLTACDETTSKEPASSQVETTTTPPEDKKPAAPRVAVSTVNGMTATQLFEKFLDEYSNARTYDLSLDMDIKEDGERTKMYLEVKLGEDDLYMNIDMDDMKMKCWVVDGVMYVNMEDGQKLKKAGADIDEIFGEGFLEEALSKAFSEIDFSDYFELLEDVQLYSYKDEYYYKISLTDEEAERLGLGEQRHSETVYFDNQGKVKKIIMSYDDEKITIDIDGYGETVTVKPPADANSYTDAG